MTGYVVHYSTSDGTTDSVATSSTSTDITGLTSGLTYTISVEATSQHLSGESEERTITVGEYSIMNIQTVSIKEQNTACTGHEYYSKYWVYIYILSYSGSTNSSRWCDCE